MNSITNDGNETSKKKAGKSRKSKLLDVFQFY